MKIISWNVNGIRAVNNKGLFLPFIQKHRPDILCLQETKAYQHQSEINLPDYEEFWNSAERKGYSGTAIFTKKKPLSVILNIPENIAKKHKLESDEYGNPNLEGRVLTVEFTDFYIVNVYTPNSKDDLSRIPLRKNKWDPAFLSFLKELENKKPVIFCGDLNVAHNEIDLARPKDNKGKKGFTIEEREGIDKIIEAGFVDTFRIFNKESGHYTWWSHFAKARERNIGWRIDYLFLSKKLAPKVKNVSIHSEVFGSDHCPVSIELQG